MGLELGRMIPVINTSGRVILVKNCSQQMLPQSTEEGSVQRRVGLRGFSGW